MSSLLGNRNEKYHEHCKFAEATIGWPAESGYILTSRDNDKSNLSNYVLSIQGLELLNAKPSVLDNESIVGRLVEALNNVGGEASKGIIRETMGLFLGAAYKASTM